jgi:hypothetical protein
VQKGASSSRDIEALVIQIMTCRPGMEVCALWCVSRLINTSVLHRFVEPNPENKLANILAAALVVILQCFSVFLGLPTKIEAPLV